MYKEQKICFHKYHFRDWLMTGHAEFQVLLLLKDASSQMNDLRVVLMNAPFHGSLHFVQKGVKKQINWILFHWTFKLP